MGALCPGRAAIRAPAAGAATRATGTAPNGERRGLAPPLARKRRLGFVKRPRINTRRSMGGCSAREAALAATGGNKVAAARLLGRDLGINRLRPAIAPMRFDRLTVILTG